MKTITQSILLVLLTSSMIHTQIYGVGNGGGFSKVVKGAQGSEFKLPISLLHFSAKPTEHHVHLTWQSSSEQNND